MLDLRSLSASALVVGLVMLAVALLVIPDATILSLLP
jgi:hypothetical protein